MFDKVVSWLEGDEDQEGLSDRDIRSAVAALYYHMISIDGVVSLKELEVVINALKDQFQLTDEQVHELVERGAKKDRESPGLCPFTVILNREFSVSQRREVLRRLNELAHADGDDHPLEAEMLNHVETLLRLDEATPAKPN